MICNLPALAACILIVAIATIGCTRRAAEPVAEAASERRATQPAPAEEASHHEPTDKNRVVATAMVSPAVAGPGDQVTVRVQLRIATGWHIYGMKWAGGMESPTRLRLKAPAELDPAFDINSDWNAPPTTATMSQTGVAQIYEGEPQFTRELTIPQTTPAGAYELVCELDFQACNQTQCLPPAHIKLPVTIKIEPQEE